MDTNLAYVAGLIDGEGCIHLDTTGNTYKARVSVGMSAPALSLLEDLRAEWGGTLYQMRPATQRWAAAYTWHMTGPPAERLLVAIRPFLRLKVAQADLAFEVQDLWRSLERRRNGTAIWTPEAQVLGEAIKQRMHALNAKGPRASATSAEVA
jgi:hypothetical protein